MIDRGSGVPVVLIPGVQGRWEWMASTVDALAERCRVITFSLSDEPSSGFTFDDRAGFGSYVTQVQEALDRAQVERAVIIGVSYSGLVATEFAARHPERVLGLVLASALPPGWTPDARARFFMRAPRLLAPLFGLSSPWRMLPELTAALPLRARLRFLCSIGYRSMRYALSPSRMARRAHWTETHKFSELSGLGMPALLITGEDRLDRIVTPALTRQYLAHLPHARQATLSATGHIGLVTRPKEFARVVCEFVNDIAAADDKRLSA